MSPRLHRSAHLPLPRRFPTPPPGASQPLRPALPNPSARRFPSAPPGASQAPLPALTNRADFSSAVEAISTPRHPLPEAFFHILPPICARTYGGSRHLQRNCAYNGQIGPMKSVADAACTKDTDPLSPGSSRFQGPPILGCLVFNGFGCGLHGASA